MQAVLPVYDDVLKLSFPEVTFLQHTAPHLHRFSLQLPVQAFCMRNCFMCHSPRTAACDIVP